MLGTRLPKSRRYSYEPRYYKPEKDEKGDRRIKFKRNRSKSAAKMRSLIWLFILLAAVIYTLIFLSRLGQ